MPSSHICQGKCDVIYDNILQTIGNTPIVKLNKTGPDNVDIYVKVEAFNPLGSVKDRLAYAIIKDATDSGELKPGQTVVEATSGNTGISLAMVCAATGHPFVATMVETFSIERRKIMRALGAKVILTPGPERGTGMVKRAAQLAEQHGWFLARQFENPANPDYHRNTTGPEILIDFAGERLDYWVTGWGTGGTLTGAGEVLKAARPDIKIIVAEPEQASMLAGDDWNPHMIQGWTPDFIPAVLNKDVCDQLLSVNQNVAKDAALALASNEGIFAGVSAGATLALLILRNAARAPGSSGRTLSMNTSRRFCTDVRAAGCLAKTFWPSVGETVSIGPPGRTAKAASSIPVINSCASLAAAGSAKASFPVSNSIISIARANARSSFSRPSLPKP